MGKTRQSKARESDAKYGQQIMEQVNDQIVIYHEGTRNEGESERQSSWSAANESNSPVSATKIGTSRASSPR